MIRRSKPLSRSSAPIARRARVRKRKAGPRANLARECARLWSEKVRAKNWGRCQVAGYDYLVCAGPLDPAHGFGVDVAPGVRFELWNGIPACRLHHEHYEARKKAWEMFLYKLCGSALYTERYAMACTTQKRDLRAVRRELEAA